MLLSAPQRGPPLACLQVGRKGRMVAEPARGAQPRYPARGCPSGPAGVRQDPQTRVTAGSFQNIHSSNDVASRTFIPNMLHCPSAFDNVFTGSDMAAKS